MKEKAWTNWQAIGIGCLVAIGASLFVFSLGAFFLPLAMKFITFVFPLSIIGALTGKHIWRNWTGSLLGAGVVVVIEFFLLLSVARIYPLD